MPKRAAKKSTVKKAKMETVASVRGLKKGDVKKPKASTEDFALSAVEKEVKDFVKGRVECMKEARRMPLPGSTKSFEDLCKEVDQEYTPHELHPGGAGRRIVTAEDETLGMRGRLVKLGTDDWQSNKASPDLYVKIQSALAILFGQNPEAVFRPKASRFKETTVLAHANWKRSWDHSRAKEQLQLFEFNLAKYGTAFARTYPKLVTMKKKVLKTYYGQGDERNEMEEKMVVKFNDLCRKNLNPKRVWVCETARPGDPLSVDDWYYEEWFSKERFLAEFGEYDSVLDAEGNCKVKFSTPPGESVGDESNKYGMTEEGVMVGFYENQLKDLYVIWVPDMAVPIYSSPLPNDDGKLSLWMAQWTLRHDECIYGIGIYEIIKNDSELFDQMMNMSMDQLVLSIYKMFFYKGTDDPGEDGKLVIEAGVGKQVMDPANVKFLDIPGPGVEAWRGLQFLQDRKDVMSGVPQQLSGKFAGRTLGQDMQAKEAALERMKTPLGNILTALREEAYISLSWQKQILSTPEVVEWTDIDDLKASLREAGLSDEEMKPYIQDISTRNPNSSLVFQEGTGETQDQMAQPEAGEPGAEGDQQMAPQMQPQMPPKQYANIYPEVAMKIEKGEDGHLFETDDERFYRFGVHMPLGNLDWEGIIEIKGESVLTPSKDIMKRNTLDLFNLVYPSIQAMTANPILVPILKKPITQILDAFDQKPKEWLAEEELEKLYQASQQPKPTEQPPRTNISVTFSDLATVGQDGTARQMNPVQKEVLQKYFGIKVEDPLFVDAGTGHGEQPAVSGGPIGPGLPGMPPIPGAPLPPEMSTKSGIEAPQVADIGKSPNTLGGAQEGATR